MVRNIAFVKPACCVSLLFSVAASGLARAGEDYYKQACDLYAKGSVAEAARLFLHITTHAPKYVPAHYQLANSYVKMGRLKQAKSEYEITKALTEDKDLQKNCDAAIAGIEKVVSTLPTSQSPGRTQSGKSSTSNRYDEEVHEYSEKVAQLQAKKDQIIKDGNEKAEKIRKEAQAQIEQENSVTMFTSRDPVTGERKPNLPQYRRDYIFEIGEEAAKKVLNDAEARARGIQIPSPPLPR